MSKSESEKDKSKSKPAAETSEKKKAPKPTPEEAAAKEVAAIEAKEKAKSEPHAPADRRLKYLKKFHGKFLPRGPLRDRHKELMQRWDSGEDHGGVTVDELKSLYEDWKAARQKPVKVKA